MEHLITPNGITVSYEQGGSGPLLVLAHGAFSDHHTNWEFVNPALRQNFTTCAIARRGRGETDATHGHSVEDEVDDLVALVEAVKEPCSCWVTPTALTARWPRRIACLAACEGSCCTNRSGRTFSQATYWRGSKRWRQSAPGTTSR